MTLSLTAIPLHFLHYIMYYLRMISARPSHRRTLLLLDNYETTKKCITTGALSGRSLAFSRRLLLLVYVVEVRSFSWSTIFDYWPIIIIITVIIVINSQIVLTNRASSSRSLPCRALCLSAPLSVVVVG